MKIQQKVMKVFEILEHFTTHEWEFTNDNIMMLNKELNEVDSKVRHEPYYPVQGGSVMRSTLCFEYNLF